MSEKAGNDTKIKYHDILLISCINLGVQLEKCRPINRRSQQISYRN